MQFEFVYIIKFCNYNSYSDNQNQITYVPQLQGLYVYCSLYLG
jgi:hypothetical protein